MNPQELIRRTAIHQDTINGLNDPTPWPVKWWAEAGDTVWTAGTATSTGEDSAGMYYEPGDIIVHRNVIDGDHTRVAGTFNIYPGPGMDPMKEMLQGIRQWDGTEPERWGEVVRPGDATLDVPGTGRTLPMGWSAGLAMAASSAGRLDPALLQASLMQAAIEHEPRPLVFFQEDNGYDLMVFSWHRNEQGLYDARSFKHLQYDDLGMQVTTISHSETPDTFPARAMSDGELLTQSRMAFDDYQGLREHDAGPDGHGITGHVARSGILKPGLEQHPLLHLADGRQAPEWDGFIDAAAIGILEGKPLTQPPVRRESRAGQEHPADAAPATRRNPLTRNRWPNVWVANRAAHPYVLHARDGHDWPKMIVSLPKGTTIDGQDLSGWATDLFMSARNRSQKNEGRAVNLRFKPGIPVELFVGRGKERRTMETDPETLAQAIIDAQSRTRDAEDPLDTRSVELASKTVEESWPLVERMQERFAEYLRAGTYQPQTALKWARRLIDRTASKPDDGPWTNRQRRQAARLLLDEITMEEGKKESPAQEHAVNGLAAARHESTAARPTGEQGEDRTSQPEQAGPPSPEPTKASGETTEDESDGGPERRHTDLKTTLARFKTRLAGHLADPNGTSHDPATAPERGRRAL
ncbi:hypothetical protein [Bifidobacterium dentium]|uniref:hypothetical protein n=1 Tax=Bifidobacterium dentium TaxID=1689 RepID=UPI0018B07AD4|nr:hypothetical protein [Bifidobacterium dentium]MBF9688033.1 hypothetical protein [Bifidobacterium dentium]